jgi:hypothetical protein
VRADAWDPARLSREVREYATEFCIRPELRFNDLRGSKVTEMVCEGISVPDLAIRIGWKIETAAKMLGVYAALNPGRAMVVALPAQVRRDDATSLRTPAGRRLWPSMRSKGGEARSAHAGSSERIGDLA